MSLIVSLLVFGFLVSIHELGHLLVAKAVKIDVQEFSIGFGPKLGSYKYHGTDYSLRLLPFFSYVRMAGAEPGDEADPGSYNSKTAYQRFWVIAAGPLSYFLLAALLFALLFGAVGVGNPTTTVQEVVANYPAEKAGLKPGDVITAINQKAVSDWDSVVNVIYENPGRPITMEAARSGQKISFVVTPVQNPDDPSRGFVGIRPSIVVVKKNPAAAIVAGIGQTLAISIAWIRGMGMIITGRLKADVVGAVGIIQMIGEASRMGLMSVVSLAAAMSANLGVLNLLPIPALDGGRLVFILLEAIRGKPVDPDKENMIHLVGFALLTLLGLFLMYKDIVRIAT